MRLPNGCRPVERLEAHPLRHVDLASLQGSEDPQTGLVVGGRDAPLAEWLQRDERRGRPVRVQARAAGSGSGAAECGEWSRAMAGE